MIFDSDSAWTASCSAQSGSYGNHGLYTQTCCVPPTYNFYCLDTYGDGWNGGYAMIDGHKFCDNFNEGSWKLVQFTGTVRSECDRYCGFSNRYDSYPGDFINEHQGWSMAESNAYWHLKSKYEDFFGAGPYSHESYSFDTWAMMYKGAGLDITDYTAVAIMWAHMSQEAGPQLNYYVEDGCPSESKCCNYNSGSCSSWTPQAQKFYGRGALQLSWEYNYADFGCAACVGTYENADVMLNSVNPMKSAVWYFILNKMHDCGTYEKPVVCFLRSVWKTNGVQECKQQTGGQNGINRAEVSNRVDKFKRAYQMIKGTSAEIYSSTCNNRSPTFVNSNGVYNCDFCDEDSGNGSDCEDHSSDSWIRGSCPGYYN